MWFQANLITQLPLNPVTEPVRAFYNEGGDLGPAHVWSSFVTHVCVCTGTCFQPETNVSTEFKSEWREKSQYLLSQAESLPHFPANSLQESQSKMYICWRETLLNLSTEVRSGKTSQIERVGLDLDY